MLFKNYQYFLTIVECGSLTKAADILYVSQPSLSQYLKRLESSLNIELFNHHSSPLELTYAGELYYSYIEKIIELEQQLSRDFNEIRNDDRDEIILGIGPWTGACLLPIVLPQFAKKYPNIEVTVIEGMTGYLINEVTAVQNSSR